MAAKIKTRSDELYQRDFCLWAERQAALLSAGRFDELDLTHLIEEVEDLAALTKSSVFNNARVVIEHLLKLEYSPAEQPRRLRQGSVDEHRSRIEIDLTPRLKTLLEADFDRLYRLARRNVASQLSRFGEDEAAERLPETCPYTVEQILSDWFPER